MQSCERPLVIAEAVRNIKLRSCFEQGKAACKREGSAGNDCSVRSSLTAKDVSPTPKLLHTVHSKDARNCNSANGVGLAIKQPPIVTDARLDTVGTAALLPRSNSWPPNHLEALCSHGVGIVDIGDRKSSHFPTSQPFVASRSKRALHHRTARVVFGVCREVRPLNMVWRSFMLEIKVQCAVVDR